MVKLRPVDPAQLDPGVSQRHGFKIELDAMPGGTFARPPSRARVPARKCSTCAEGKRAAHRSSPEQRDFYAAHAPAEIKMNALVPLGPTFLLRTSTSRKRSIAVSSSSFGSIPTGPASSKSRPSAFRKKPSRLPRISRPTLLATAWRSVRRGAKTKPRWSSSAPTTAEA